MRLMPAFSGFGVALMALGRPIRLLGMLSLIVGARDRLIGKRGEHGHGGKISQRP
jgi:hypothetical protein